MKSRTRSLIAITVIPVALIGVLLWWVTGLVPECSNTVLSTLESPDAGKALVVFARDCGGAGLNTQAVIMPPGGTLEGDATGFLAVGGGAGRAAGGGAAGKRGLAAGGPVFGPPPGVTLGGRRPRPPTPAGTPMEISK